VAAVAAFAHLTEDYLTGDPLVRWDLEFARWLHEHASSRLVSVFDIVTLAGNAVVLAALTAGAIWFLLRRRAVNDAALLAVVALGIEILNAVLKLAFHRARPELGFAHLDTYSYPSGHAAGATAIYGALAYLVARRLSGAWRIAPVAAALVAIALIGFSRLYLGVHYLSDVLAGISVGASWLFLWLLIDQLRGDRPILPLLPARVRRVVERVGR
jgi:undecaprenyl-diphosphatase